jgi:hypothetical protein
MAARFKTFTAGSVLTASEVNTYLAKQAVINCDSSADYPSAPVVGMTVYDLNDDALYVYAGATSGWRPPWNLPWGRVASASTTTNTTSIGSSYTDLTGLSVTWTAVTNRRYKVTGYTDLSSTSAGLNNVRITDGSNNKTAETQFTMDANALSTHNPIEVFTGTSGSVTRKLRARVGAGTGGTQANVYGPHLILVEDIGPAGAPS